MLTLLLLVGLGQGQIVGPVPVPPVLSPAQLLLAGLLAAALLKTCLSVASKTFKKRFVSSLKIPK